MTNAAYGASHVAKSFTSPPSKPGGNGSRHQAPSRLAWTTSASHTVPGPAATTNGQVEDESSQRGHEQARERARAGRGCRCRALRDEEKTRGPGLRDDPPPFGGSPPHDAAPLCAPERCHDAAPGRRGPVLRVAITSVTAAAIAASTPTSGRQNAAPAAAAPAQPARPQRRQVDRAERERERGRGRVGADRLRGGDRGGAPTPRSPSPGADWRTSAQISTAAVASEATRRNRHHSSESPKIAFATITNSGSPGP